MSNYITDDNISNDGRDDGTVTGSESEPIPHAGNDETGAELAQPNPHVESNNQSYSGRGPRTAKGKVIASRNALKHGIFSNAIQLTSESHEQYDSLLTGLWEHFKPMGMLEEVLVEKLAILTWRYRRLISTETEELQEIGNPFEESNSGSAILDRFPRYEATIERSFDRTLTQLERIQRMRRGEPVAPPIKLDIS
jgi:hypothetical protein